MYPMHCLTPKYSLSASPGMRSLMLRRAQLICAIAVFLCLPVRHAGADIYQYTDQDGVIHFSNVGVGNAKKFRKVRTEQKHRRHVAHAPAPASHAPDIASQSPTNEPVDYMAVINNACHRNGVDPKLVHAIVKVESDFNPYALSRKGAMGLMQLMPQTAINMNVHNIFNPHENVDGGVRYLRYLLDRYEGNLSLALAAYNAGETAVKKWGTVPPYPETQNYVQRILKLYNGTGISTGPRYTIFIGYGDDGAVTLTDDPSKQREQRSKRTTSQDL
jgi:Transglycosylase SLT domain/Domain of unknown function (DUF4124)